MTRTSLTNVPLPRPVQPTEATDLERNWAAVSPELIGLRVNLEAQSVTCESPPGADTSTLQEKVGRYLDFMLAKTKPVGTRVLFSRTAHNQAARAGSTFEDLRRLDFVTEHGEGAVGFAGAALDVFFGLDHFLRKIFARRFGAAERRFPALIPYEVMAKCGSFDSHPDTATFVTHLHSDLDVIAAFRAEQIDQPNRTSPPSSDLAPSTRCLCPASCFPCYHAFQGRVLSEPGLAVSLLGRVFRFESRRLTGLERLWEFNQREIVFFGTHDFVERARERLVALFQEVANDWDLACSLETAVDAFIPQVHVSRSYWQRIAETKYEMRLAIGREASGEAHTVAASSINMHGEFFSERFDISLPNGTNAVTACCGWGLERWVLALFARHGLELSVWPRDVRLALQL